MNEIDTLAKEYLPDAATATENDLIMHWYPQRIIKRFDHCDSLLELGLGHGFTAVLFNPVCKEHIVLEGSQTVIENFNKSHPDFSGNVILSYFEDYDTDKTFDVIVMGFVLEHVDDPRLILEKYKKYLKPGGKMYITTPNAKSLNRRLGLELGKIDSIYSLNSNDIALGHKRQFCRDTLKQLIIESGYRVTYEEGVYLKPLPLAVLKTLDDFEGNLQAMLKVGVDFPDLCVSLLMEVIPA